MQRYFASSVAFVAFVAFLVPLGCQAQSPPARPAAASPSRRAPPWPDWSPSAAITRCVAANDEARREPSDLEASRALMVACSSLVGGPQCREVTAKQWGSEPTPTFLDVVGVCAKEYCPRLGDAPELVACQFDARDPAFDAAEAWAPLRQSMLLHDFPESELPAAARALVAATDTIRSVPPLSVPASAGPADLEVQLKPDGSITLVQNGNELATVASPEELASVTPKPTPDARVALAAGRDVPHARMIAVMDALRTLGYRHLSFGPVR